MDETAAVRIGDVRTVTGRGDREKGEELEWVVVDVLDFPTRQVIVLEHGATGKTVECVVLKQKINP